jgi:hypothetical protein
VVVACSGRVSPKSKSRKPAKARQRLRPAERRQPSRTGRLREPGLRAAYDAIIEPMRELTNPAIVPDAYEAEVMVSVLIGLVIQAGLTSDLLATALLDVVDELARSGLAHAYPALRALGVLGPPEISESAARAADRVALLAGRLPDGAAELTPAAASVDGFPAWVSQLGQVTPGACVVLADPYGETQTLLCEFAYAGGTRAHGVLATLDAAWHGGLTALNVVDQPALARQRLAKLAGREGAALQEILASEAGQRLRSGIDAFLRHGCPPEMGQKDDSHGDLCASLSLARHRASTLTGSASTLADSQDPPLNQLPDQPAVPDDLAAHWPQDLREQIAQEFLASPQGRDLPGPFARKIPFLFIAACTSNLGCDPLLIGPLLLERILLHMLPVSLTAPDRLGAEIPPAVRAWTGWLAERRDLPSRHRKRLMLQLDFLLNRFLVLWAKPDLNPLRRYVQDLPDEVVSDGELMIPVVERRLFAVPEPAARAEGLVRARSGQRDRQASDLDAADEIDRQLITVLSLSSRGVAQQRFASYTAVTEQIWANDPPEVCAAAYRLQVAGYTREAILDRLAEAWRTTAAQSSDGHAAAQQADGYAAALARLAGPRLR